MIYDTVATDSRRMNFIRLTHAEQLAAIRRLAAGGLTDRDIGAATGWSLELVRGALSPDSSATNAARMQ